MTEVVVGNAGIDGAAFRGWFVGDFVPAELGLRSTSEVEVKWQRHASGEIRPGWGSNPGATSLSMLVSGCIRLQFEDGSEAVLREPGDYALWARGVAHRWSIEQDDTVVLTVRWPSA